jgi:hypothetical protein
MVGTERFELSTSCSRSKRSTRLSYVPFHLSPEGPERLANRPKRFGRSKQNIWVSGRCPAHARPDTSNHDCTDGGGQVRARNPIQSVPIKMRGAVLISDENSLPLPMKPLLSLLLAAVLATASSAADAGWRPLFNGKDLDGWTVKIAGHPVGENYADTYRVEDGIIKANYDKYDKFGMQFGHLYSNVAYSHYLLRLQYRFAGKVLPDAPEWCNSNSGVMIHSQSPLSMTLEQPFPVSLEFQFLADVGPGPRQTGNVCTPGTNLEIGGKLVTQHIVPSTAPVFPPDEWVQVEIEVHGNREVIHRVNGREVLRYQHPQLDPDERDPVRHAEVARLLSAGAPFQLSYGHIALQAEGHPVWFRNVELLPLQD